MIYSAVQRIWKRKLGEISLLRVGWIFVVVVF